MSIATPPRTIPSMGAVAAPGGGSSPPAGTPPSSGRPPIPPPAPRPRRTVVRIVLGSLLVLLAAAGASAVAVLDEVHTLRDALNQNAALRIAPGTLANAGWGDPQTLLLVGNDARPQTGAFRYYSQPVLPHSNEMLLVRFDPGRPYISMMSIPRELMVMIPCPNGPVTTRLNYALTCGGIPTLVTTIRQLTGLSVNHVVEIDFTNFKRAVDEIGCVYSTVDRRYFHVNTPTSAQYQEINLQPGYQKMCGTQALEFVSYRHGDTSLVRDARDQDFLLDVKQEYGPTLIDNIHKFETIFGQTVQTDPGLHTTTGLLNLLGTLISSESLQVRQVQFQVTLEPTGANPCSCDIATPQQISASVNAFLNGGLSIPKKSTAQVARALHSRKAIAQLPLVAVPAAELAQAHRLASTVPFTFEYPQVQDAGGSATPVYLRAYLIHAPGGVPYPAYVAVFATGQLGQYYDVQGMTWTTAPLFDSPTQTVTVGRRTYYLFYSGQHLRTVAWYAHDAVYWVHNTITDALGNGEMLAIAEQTVPMSVSSAEARHARLSLRAAGVPLRTTAAQTSSLRRTVGGLAGLVTLLALPLLAILAIVRIRQLRRPRAQLAIGRQIGERLPVPFGTYARGAGHAGAAGAVGAPGGAGGAGAVGAGAGAASLAGAGHLSGAASLTGAAFARAAIAAPPAGMATPYLPTRMRSDTKVYRPSRWRTVLLSTGIVAVIAGALASVVVIVEGGHSRNLAAARRAAAAARAQRIPTVPVVVLNATSVPGAAHRLAHQLASDGVRVLGTGNVVEARPPGIEILYATGERAQAEKLARLLASRSPVVGPVDPVSAAAAGANAKLVVVIT